MVERADTIVAVSENLQERLAKMGRASTLLTHGVDVKFWKAGGGSASILDGLPRPLILFWGVIDQRMDVSWLRHLSASLSAGTIVLVGPENDPDSELKRFCRGVVRDRVCRLRAASPDCPRKPCGSW